MITTKPKNALAPSMAPISEPTTISPRCYAAVRYGLCQPSCTAFQWLCGRNRPLRRRLLHIGFDAARRVAAPAFPGAEGYGAQTRRRSEAER